MMNGMAIMMRPEVPVLLQLSQPFYFSIYDTASSVVLFQGKVEEPSGGQGHHAERSFDLDDTSHVFYGPIHRETCPVALFASASFASVNFTSESIIGNSVTWSCLGVCFVVLASALYIWHRCEVGMRPAPDDYIYIMG